MHEPGHVLEKLGGCEYRDGCPVFPQLDDMNDRATEAGECADHEEEGELEVVSFADACCHEWAVMVVDFYASVTGFAVKRSGRPNDVA